MNTNDVVLLLTDIGNIVGSYQTESDDEIILENACIITGDNKGGLQIIPLLYMLSEEKTYRINKSRLLCNQTFEPVPELRNTYSTNYGSGLQLLG